MTQGSDGNNRGSVDRRTSDRVVIDRGPGRDRAILLQDGRVVEVLADYSHAPNRIGSIHRARIDRVVKDQNRAFATLADGTDVSIRLGKSDRLNPGELQTITVIAAPRHDKAWQAVSGARIISANLILLPDQHGITRSRAMPADAPDITHSETLLQQLLTEVTDNASQGQPMALILRRGAAGQSGEALVGECRALMNDWLNITTDPDPDWQGMIYDGGGIGAQARRLAPSADFIDTADMGNDGALLEDFDTQFDAAIESARASSAPLAGGGVMWVTPTRALTAIDLDSGAGSLHALFDAAPVAIARRLRLVQIGGLVAIDVPRAQPAVMRRFTSALAAEFAKDPRAPDILGRTRGGILECRLPYGQPFPPDLAGPEADMVLTVLLQIARRPMLATPTIALSPAMAQWLDHAGGAALRALDRPVARVVSSDVTIASLIETAHD